MVVSDLVKHIEEARRGLAAASRRGDWTASGKGAKVLMDATWEIGTAVYATADGGEAVRPPELESFIAETADILWEAESGLANWLPHVTDRRPEDDGSYRGWIRERSAIEFLRDLYKGTDGGDYAAELGTDMFDEEILFRAGQYNVGTPPAGIPRHHWWWWTP
jgi:hypothetical protein